MMKIAVIGANGKAGKLIANEAVKRGFDVTAIVRSENQSQAQHVLQKDIFALTREDLQGFDAVVNTFWAWTEDTLPGHKKLAELLIDALRGTQTRLFVVWWAGSLYVNPEHTIQLKDTPEFPEIFMAVANASAEAYDIITKNQDINWVYVTPPADFRPEIENRGAYSLWNGEFALNSRGESAISYADYALAMVDLIEQNRYNQQVVSVNGK